MRPPHTASRSGPRADPDPAEARRNEEIRRNPPAAVTVHQLAHELNSLLDGAMRLVSLAQAGLTESGREARGAHETALGRLKTAHNGLQRMAQLLQRTMRNPGLGTVIFDEEQPLESQVQMIVESLQPMAIEHHVRVAIDITPKAGLLPSATLGPVILNGLRNAIEACAEAEASERRVELSIAIDRFDQLMILIVDTGPGTEDDWELGRSTKPTGHGLGLRLSSDIVDDLGGTLRLSSIPFGGGAILQVFVPLRSLTRHD